MSRSEYIYTLYLAPSMNNGLPNVSVSTTLVGVFTVKYELVNKAKKLYTTFPNMPMERLKVFRARDGLFMDSRLLCPTDQEKLKKAIEEKDIWVMWSYPYYQPVEMELYYSSAGVLECSDKIRSK